MAGGGDDHILHALKQQAFIFLLNQGSPHRCFLRLGEAKLQKTTA